MGLDAIFKRCYALRVLERAGQIVPQQWCLMQKGTFSDQKTLAVLVEDEEFKYQQTSEVSKTEDKAGGDKRDSWKGLG